MSKSFVNTFEFAFFILMVEIDFDIDKSKVIWYIWCHIQNKKTGKIMMSERFKYVNIPLPYALNSTYYLANQSSKLNSVVNNFRMPTSMLGQEYFHRKIYPKIYYEKNRRKYGVVESAIFKKYIKIPEDKQ